MIEIGITGNIKTKGNSEIKKSKSSILSITKKKNEEKVEEQTIKNPFGGQAIDPNMPSFNNNILNEESQTMNSLLSDNNVPLDIKRKHWWVFSRDNSLTFLDKERKADKLLSFDIVKIDMLNSMPYYDYDFETEKEINVLRNAYTTKLDRALGTDKASQLNERIAQKSQFNENRQISKDESTNQSAGFIGKLLNRR